MGGEGFPCCPFLTLSEGNGGGMGKEFGRLRMDSGQHRRVMLTALMLGIAAFFPLLGRLLTLMVEPGTPLEAWVREGSFTLLSPLEVLKETELFLQHVDSEGTVFRANHASNYLILKGTLNRDKAALLKKIDAALEGKQPFRWPVQLCI